MAEDYLAAHARAFGDRPAVIDDRPETQPRQLTFAELDRASNRIANALRAAGVAAGEKVTWCGRDSIGIAVFSHAARKAGCVAVPLNYRLSNEETAYVVENSDSVLAWVAAEHAPTFAQIRGAVPGLRHVVVFDGEAAHGQLGEDEFLHGVGGDTAPDDTVAATAGTMTYTSGTTGHPKGTVRHNQRSGPQVKALLSLMGYRPDDVYLPSGPLYHSGPGGFAGLAWAYGHTVVLQHKFDAEDWLRLVDTYRVTTTFAAPTPIRRVCTLPEQVAVTYDVSSMRIMIANAAPWSLALKELYVSRFPPSSLWEVYGSTELGVSCVLAPDDQLRKPGSCGKPAPLVEIALFDDDGTEITEPHTPGELFVRASTVFDTYYKAEEKYANDHREGGFHTVGDIAYRDEAGYYFICDRKNDMIISGGVNIYPAEVEAALERSAEIYDVAVLGVPSEEWGETVHAVVVRGAGSAIDEAGVIAFARDHIAGYKVPRTVSFTDELPRSGSGKVLKRELRTQLAAEAGEATKAINTISM